MVLALDETVREPAIGKLLITDLADSCMKLADLLSSHGRYDSARQQIHEAHQRLSTASQIFGNSRKQEHRECVEAAIVKYNKQVQRYNQEYNLELPLLESQS